MNPAQLLIDSDGREVVKIGGFVLPAEDFNLARFLRDDLGTTWLHAGGIASTKRLLEKLEIRAGMSVLDMGCGVGSAMRYMAQRVGCKLTGLDSDPEMIRRARRSTPHKAFPNVQFQQGDAVATGFAENSFDRVIVQSLACFLDKAALFKEVVRILKPGGRVGLNEVTWLQPPSKKVEKVMCATICETFRGALLASDWVTAMKHAGLSEISASSYPFTASTPYQVLREEGFVETLRIMWRVLQEPEINMRLSAMSDLFRRSPEYFSYGLYVGHKPHSA